jgi:hypothetical protein
MEATSGTVSVERVAERSNMRTREMSYSDYGITENEVQYIKDFCRNAEQEQQKIIKQALSELQPYIAPYVFYSLVDNLSYEDICAKNYLYIGKGDFYGHRRQGMEAIKRWMILYNIWEM